MFALPDKSRHVYHLSPARLLPLPLLWAAIAGMLLTLSASADSNPAEARAFLWTALLVTVIMLPFLALLWQSRLVLTAEGISHHQFGYTIRSRWDNLQTLRLAPGAQSLVLAQPGTCSRPLRWSARILARAVPVHAGAMFGDVDRLAEGRLILIAPFMAHWRRGPLREDLRRWAPHLFDAGGKPRAPGQD